MVLKGKVIAAQKHGTVEDSFVMCAEQDNVSRKNAGI